MNSGNVDLQNEWTGQRYRNQIDADEGTSAEDVETFAGEKVKTFAGEQVEIFN